MVTTKSVFYVQDANKLKIIHVHVESVF